MEGSPLPCLTIPKAFLRFSAICWFFDSSQANNWVLINKFQPSGSKHDGVPLGHVIYGVRFNMQQLTIITPCFVTKGYYYF